MEVGYDKTWMGRFVIAVGVLQILLVSNVTASAQSVQLSSAEKRTVTSVTLESTGKSRHRQVIASYYKTAGILRVLNEHRSAAAAALGAVVVSDSEWLIPQGEVKTQVKVIGQNGSILKDKEEPKPGKEEVVSNCECKSKVKGAETGCIKFDVGSYNIVRAGYATCQTHDGSSCTQTYTEVVTKHSYVDGNCQNETKVTPLEFQWICLP